MAGEAVGGSGGGAAAGGTAVAPPAAEQQQEQPPAAAAQQQPKSRHYPDEPRVGVGVVILRQLPQQPPEVLLIRRAKEPSKGAPAASV